MTESPTLPNEDRQELINALHRHPDGDFPRMCKPTNASNPRCLHGSSPTFLNPPAFQAPVLGVGKIGSYTYGQRAREKFNKQHQYSLCGAATMHSVLSPHLKSRSQHACGPSCTAVWVQFAMSGP